MIGTWLSFFIFGGEFPGNDMVPRFFIVHVLLIPGLILALVTVHLILVVYYRHTQYPGPGRTNRNVVGYPLYPVYTAKAGGFFFIVFGVTAVMGALLQINPVWLYGPYNPAEVTAGAQPDWYMGWLEGSVRLMPGFETQILGVTLSWNLIIPALLVPPRSSPWSRCTRSSSSGSPATNVSTTCWTGRATSRPGPVSASRS